MKLKGTVERTENLNSEHKNISQRQQKIVLFSGIIILILVPVFKTLTHFFHIWAFCLDLAYCG